MNPRNGPAALSGEDVRRFHAALARIPVRQGWFERALCVVIRAWCRAVAWRVSVTSAAPLPERDGVPGAGCVVATAPHRAWLEPFLLLAAWPADAARLVWLADGRTATRSWWRRRLLPRLGVIPITSGSGPHRYAELAAAVCERGLAVAVFPEVGPPSSPDRTRRISAGFAYLALRAGAPIVPVVIGGTHHVVRGSSFSVDILPAIDGNVSMPDPFTPAGRAQAGRLAERFEREVAAVLPERTREADAAAPERDRWTWLNRLLS